MSKAVRSQHLCGMSPTMRAADCWPSVLIQHLYNRLVNRNFEVSLNFENHFKNLFQHLKGLKGSSFCVLAGSRVNFVRKCDD